MKTPLYTNDMFSIQTIVDLINDHPDFTFVLVGHTHSQGADKANLILSVDRAETMKLLLTQDFGLNPDRISTKGEGGTNPVAENRTSFGRSLNRRVELRINNGEF